MILYDIMKQGVSIEWIAWTCSIILNVVLLLTRRSLPPNTAEKLPWFVLEKKRADMTASLHLNTDVLQRTTETLCGVN